MTTSLVDAESVVTVDIGSVTTRALLFDVVDGIYTFVAAGSAPSTAAAPFRDVSEGVHNALVNLQKVVGRKITGADGHIIIPAQSSGAGVDRLAITFSAGPELRLVVAGLLGDVSLESARHLAASTYARVVETIGLNDRRRMDMQLDAVLRAEPDIILVAGGTDGGASRSVGKLLELVSLVCRVLPQDKRPEVIYAGNQALDKRVRDHFEKLTMLQVAPNIRPSIDSEDLSPAQVVLQNAAMRLRRQRVIGLEPLAALCAVPPMPSVQAFGRMVRFLSKVYDPQKGVLGLDLGASATLVAAAVAGQLDTAVYPLGMGAGLVQALPQLRIEEIIKWLPMHVPEPEVRDYLWNKSLHPNSLPLTAETLAIEQATARQMMRLVMQQFFASHPEQHMAYEPILASGTVVAQAPTPGQSLLMLLDGLQPVGVTILMLDQNGLIAPLGAASTFNPVLPVQVLESGAFLNLGTVISPVSEARYGTPILQVRLEYGQSNETRLEVRQGSLVQLPLKMGQVARIHLNGLHGTEIDARGKRGKVSFKIVGGACGAVIDARGRPLNLPPDASRRRDLLHKWAMAVGG